MSLSASWLFKAADCHRRKVVEERAAKHFSGQAARRFGLLI
jgi:hypothetical protein